MGLSICRSIINAHGGRLWAETNDPRGAVFQFILPCADLSYPPVKFTFVRQLLERIYECRGAL
jgi:hypothetical protein